MAALIVLNIGNSMVQSKEVTLRTLIDNFGLELVEDLDFFREWQDDLPEITELDRKLLDKVRGGFVNLLNYPPMIETVRMAVLDPLLFIGDFFLNAFYMRSEEPVSIKSEDEGLIITGRIDTLVSKDQLWVMIIESKRASYSIEAGLAQILSYMLGSPNLKQPIYGMITTGGSFAFVKLIKSNKPLYALSKIFFTRNPLENELYKVLQILKCITELIISNNYA